MSLISDCLIHELSLFYCLTHEFSASGLKMRFVTIAILNDHFVYVVVMQCAVVMQFVCCCDAV